MRRSLLSNFHAVWIDNLNGDKYRTGKIIPKGLSGAGTRDESAFTTDLDPRGIQPGTAISTWVKRLGLRTQATDTTVQYRDFWGMATSKRQGLLASLPSGSPAKDSAVPAYQTVAPSSAGRWRLAPRTTEGGFEAWPALDELFPVTIQGVNHNRGLDGGIIDTDRKRLEQRVRSYFEALDFAAARKASKEIATARARYNPETVWATLKHAGHFRRDAVMPLLTFPLDRRFIYYVSTDKWLNEARAELARNVQHNEFLVTVPEPRKASETFPLYSTELVNLHVHERGSVVFPRETRGDDLLSDRDANLTEQSWRVLRSHFGLNGERREAPARSFVSELFRVAFAMLYAPAYQAEHKSALGGDWAHLPIPKDRRLFDRLVDTGEQIARLLDAARDAQDVVEKIVGADRFKHLGPLRRADGRQVRAEDLKLTVTYWGGGKGRWKPRPFASDEAPAADYAQAWGVRTGDLYLNNDAFFSNVPEEVWTFQLGGYPVLKKWLGYRQADRRDGRPLSDDERRWFREMIQRVAALLALGPQLDSLYQEVAINAFTAEDLGIPR